MNFDVLDSALDTLGEVIEEIEMSRTREDIQAEIEEAQERLSDARREVEWARDELSRAKDEEEDAESVLSAREWELADFDAASRTVEDSASKPPAAKEGK